MLQKNIVIIHYNTPLLTECLVRSINRFVEDAVIYIFDNSDTDPFILKPWMNNLKILDNTKGEIINFDKWLEGYPDRDKSSEATKIFGSAKHCYSIEKCIELIDENFILLDSDVLLKKDISCLYDDSVIYAGEVVKQPFVSVKRVVPFVCFINVEMMKKHGKHYFYDDYMHGLYNIKTNEHADWYDTGAGFYINTLDLPHMEISCEDYVVHYGHGSWKKSGYNYIMSSDEWLLHNKKYWSYEMNKKVVYTCITGGYDKLKTPKEVTLDFDYICFTDDTSLKSDIWEIRPLPEEVSELSNVKKQRYVKINAHKLLPEYDLSVWVDGSILIKGNLNELISQEAEEGISIYVPQHPSRDCIYREAKTVIAMKKDKPESVNPQVDRYKEEGFPSNYGLLQSNIMIRLHNNQDCVKFMTEWFDELYNGSYRDQLSFNYVSWKNPNIKIKYIDKNISKSKWFEWFSSHPKDEKKQPEGKKIFYEVLNTTYSNNNMRLNELMCGY